jgi:hypothetical protein
VRAEHLRYPDFLCIGGRKAGTTWLHRCLAAHPGIFMPPVKEVHYFDTLYIPEFGGYRRRTAATAQRRLARDAPGRIAGLGQRLLSAVGLAPGLNRVSAKREFNIANADASLDDRWYGRLFAAAKPAQIASDFTPNYALLPDEGVRHAHRLNPDARVLFILRHPVERAFSHAKWIAGRGRRPFDDARLLVLVGKPTVYRCDESLETIDRWTGIYGPAQVKVMFYDRIASAPLPFLQEVCGFLRLDYSPDYFTRASQIVNKGPAYPMSDELREELKSRFAAQLAQLRSRFPTETVHWN